MLTLVKKEITDAFRNKLFLALLGMLFTLILVAVVLGALQVRVNVDCYQQSVAQLQTLGKTELPPPPAFNPLGASKNFVNYIGLLGALMAIILGNFAIVNERRGETMRLILSRRVFRDSFLNGKFIGNLVLLLFLSIFGFLVTMGILIAISHAPIGEDDLARLALFFLVAFLYMAFFMLLGAFMAILVPGGNRALLITVILWLLLAFIFPQIGDTMDLDNQLPGGFFASMGMNKNDSQQVLDKFKLYETLRDGVEELSPTKHFERAGFALLNVKPGFDKNTAWEIMGIKWFDVVALLSPCIILWLGSYMILLRREDIFND